MNEVKDVMVENIEKVLERGERIELLVDKTDVLRNQVRGGSGPWARTWLAMAWAAACPCGMHCCLLGSGAARPKHARRHCAPRLLPAPQAEVFQKKGRSLRNKMWWNYCKWKLLVAAIILVLAVIIFVVACFSGGRDCTQQNARESGGGGVLPP